MTAAEWQALVGLGLLLVALLCHGAARLSDALDDLLVPGSGASPHHRATTFGGHFIVGACAASVVVAIAGPLPGFWMDALPVIVGLIYWLAKELPDLRRGGRFWDGVEDAVGVALGAVYAGPWWWPFLGLAFMALLMVRGREDREGPNAG